MVEVLSVVPALMHDSFWFGAAFGRTRRKAAIGNQAQYATDSLREQAGTPSHGHNRSVACSLKLPVEMPLHSET
jgi:hypothetical protein